MWVDTILKEVQLVWRLMWDRRVPLWMKGIPLFAVIYVLSPVDLIPDVIIGLGQLDDLGILIGSLRLFRSVLPEDILREHLEVIEGNVIEVRDYQVTDED